MLVIISAGVDSLFVGVTISEIEDMDGSFRASIFAASLTSVLAVTLISALAASFSSRTGFPWTTVRAKTCCVLGNSQLKVLVKSLCECHYTPSIGAN